MNTREIGKQKEKEAELFLQKQNIKILERNFRCRQGEIDLVGLENDVLVFVEVKYRKTNVSGRPEEAVSHNKQEKICRVCDYYRMTHPFFHFKSIRFDVVAIDENGLRWYQNAFSYIERNGNKSW